MAVNNYNCSSFVGHLIVMSLLLFRFLNAVNRDNGSLKLDFNSESLPRSDNSSGRLETLGIYRSFSFFLRGNAKFIPSPGRTSSLGCRV